MNALVPFEVKPRVAQTANEARLFDSLAELRDVLLRRRLALLGCVAGSVLLAGAYLIVTPSKYTAAATLMVDAHHTDVVHTDTVADAQIMNAMVESEVEVLRSEGLAREVVDRLDLTSDPLFRGRTVQVAATDANRGPEVARERAAQQLLRMIGVKRIGMTYVIEVDATATSAREAARLANGVSDAYFSMQAKTQGTSTRRAADWLSDQLEALRQRALSADEDVQSFKAAHAIIETDQGSLDKEQAATLNGELLAATARTTQAQARVDGLSALLKQNGGMAGGVSDLIQDPVLTSLQQHYFDISQREAELAARYGNSHAIVVKLRGRMADLQASVHQEVARLAAGARSDLAIARAGEATIRTQLATLIGQSGTAGTARAQLRSLESSAAIYRTLYTNSLQHYAQSMQDSSFPVVAAHVVSEAEPPLAKSKPKRSLILAGALVLGVGGGVVLALLLEFLDQGLASAGQIERQLGVPCLARLPRLTWRGSGVRPDVSTTTTILDFPNSRFAGEIRRLRLRIIPFLGEDRCGVIGVVSSRKDSGTTTVARNLSSALMASGRSVALVSLDDTAPQVPSSMSAAMTGANALTVFDVRSVRFGELARRLDDLRRIHDVLVLDLPPLFGLDGAEDVVRALSGIVLVARNGATSARDMIDLVEGSGIDWSLVAGVVLNCCEHEVLDETVH